MNLPPRPNAWFLVATASEVRRSRLLPVDVGELRVVVGRSSDGTAFAMDARCPHMGADLAAGRLEGDSVRCGLHHFRYDLQGRCVQMPGAPDEPDRAPRVRTRPVVERFGGVFVFCGSGEPFAPPRLLVQDPEHTAWAAGPPVEVGCPWPPLITNGFDMQHLRTVHRRELRTEPVATTVDPTTYQLKYVSRVTGRALSDRVMRRLSGDHIDVCVSCHGGSVMLAEVDLGRTRSAVLMGVLPKGEHTVARCLFGVPAESRIVGARLLVARWLYTSFLRQDVQVLRGMRFDAPPALQADAVLRSFVTFLEQLP